MRIVESSLIWYFTRQDRAVSLSFGFAPKKKHVVVILYKKFVTQRRQYRNERVTAISLFMLFIQITRLNRHFTVGKIYCRLL